MPNFYIIWIADGKPRSRGWAKREAAYESKTTGNGSTQQTSRDDIVEGSRAGGGGGGGRGRDGAVGSRKQGVSTGESLEGWASREAAEATYPLVAF